MATEKAAQSRFWDDLVELLNRAGVPEKALRWYVRRVEQYIAAHANLALHEHQASQVTEYLARTGRDGDLQGWQFRQIVHALQLLFTEHVRAQWSDGFDWQYWRDSAQELEAAHPTVARHNSPLPPSAPLLPPADAKALVYPQLMRDVIAEIRRRNYSIRTEQAYIAWLRRYVAFHDNRDPCAMGAEQVAAYLSHMALIYTHVLNRPGVSVVSPADLT